MYMLWVQVNGVLSEDKIPKWYTVCEPNANGGISKFNTLDNAIKAGKQMTKSKRYLDFAITDYDDSEANWRYYITIPKNVVYPNQK